MEVVVTTLDGSDAPGLHALFESHEGWDWRTIEDVQAAVENADDAVGLEDAETGELVAAARILTDFVYYARIYDVIVAAEYCGQGLGTRLMEVLVERPAVTETKRVTLRCDENLVAFYERVGFAVEETDGDDEEEGSVLMQFEGEAERDDES